MHLYRQSIALFGFVAPALIAAVVIGGVLFARSSVNRSFQQKIGAYEGYESNKIAALGLEAAISQKRDDMSRWVELVSEETASVVTSHLREIEEDLPSKEFQKTGQEHPAQKGSFGNASAQDSAQVRLAFRATFRSMQRALLELESRMPQLQLQEMRIDPSQSSNNLNVQVTYTAWEQ